MTDLASSETSLSTLLPNFMSSELTIADTTVFDWSPVSSTPASLQPSSTLYLPSSTLYLPSVTITMTHTHTYTPAVTVSADPDPTDSQSPSSLTPPPESSCSTVPATQRMGPALTSQCPCVCKAKLDNFNQHSALVSWRKRLEEELLVDKSELYSTWLKKNSVENVTKSAKYMGSTLCCIFLCLIFGVILALDLTKVILYLCTLSKSRRKDSKSY
ncbi:uncharacterized protein LOC131940903 [Physella acuta]|uniref:uncharacterized protein LOC131940903 n=1 Tax=Physella acuta TaxID=109671 RepID=UPI0027DE4DBC|nr:uncharacterized protein LOC131940903 [Physella acuta]